MEMSAPLKEPFSLKKSIVENECRHVSMPGDDLAGNQVEHFEKDASREYSESYQASISSQMSLNSTKPLDTARSHKKLRRCCSLRKRWQTLLYLIVLLFIMDLIVIPGWFYTCPWIRRKSIYWNFWGSVPEQPSAYGFANGYSYSVLSERGIDLGVWYLAGNNTVAQPQLLPGGEPVIFLYLHGNKDNRASHHSINLYQVLTDMNLSVVTFDYRGYADSSGVPTSTGFVQDALAVYRNIRTKVKAKRIVVWGYSMGTGVANRHLAELTRIGDVPAGLVLEAPFDHIANTLRSHVLTYPLRILPCFEQVYLDSLRRDPATHLDSSEAVTHIDTSLPILILHAKCDGVVPFALGISLYKTLLRYRLEVMFNTTHIDRRNGNRISNLSTTAEKRNSDADYDDTEGEVSSTMYNVMFKALKGERCYGHTQLQESPNLTGIVRQFVRLSIMDARAI